MPRFLFFICVFFIGNNLFAQTTIHYQSSTIDFPNPERGFYRYTAAKSTGYNVLNPNALQNYRSLHTPPGNASYSIRSTLVFRYFFLENFTNSSIPQWYLDNMQADFTAARQAGVKVIPRFAYTNQVDGSTCASWICPPYGDAPKNWVLTHINQIAPILEANKDVIAVVHMGFIGVWGENYYTDYFGDASLPPYKLLDNNWIDRIDVVNALLSAIPQERMLQVRYPQQKQRAIYGINAPTNAAPLIESEAFQGTAKARLGFHNDCLLASPDDWGTYQNYGNSSTGTGSDTTNLKAYFAADSKFVAVGGETCNDNGYDIQNNCASTNTNAFGDEELERMHYSYLNAQYNNQVNNDWQSGGCMEEIKRRLGYRFELQNATFSNTSQAGKVINLSIDLKNNGYASPYNTRGLELVLRNTITGDTWFADLPQDPRFWFAGNDIHSITETLCIPTTMPLGNYEVLLNLPDPMPAIYDRPEYSIRLANLLPSGSDVWEPSTGYNKLGHTITIDNTTNTANCNGEITFTSLSSILPVDLVEFKARPKEEHIMVNWTTALEINNKGFHLERSTDSRNFTTIKWVEGSGESNTPIHYAVEDKAVLPYINYYYRLAQLDFDGKLTYSPLVSARTTAKGDNTAFENSINISPNPIENEATISWNKNIEQVQSIDVLNVLGEQLLTLPQNTTTIDMTPFDTGVYYFRFNTPTAMYIKKVIKI